MSREQAGRHYANVAAADSATVNVASGCSSGAPPPSGSQAQCSTTHCLLTGIPSSRLGWKPNLFPKAHSQQLKDLVLKMMFRIKKGTLSGDTGIFQNLCFLWSFPIVFFPSLLICFVAQGGTESISSEIHCELMFYSIESTLPRQKVNGRKLA